MGDRREVREAVRPFGRSGPERGARPRGLRAIGLFARVSTSSARSYQPARRRTKLPAIGARPTTRYTSPFASLSFIFWISAGKPSFLMILVNWLR